MRIVMMGTGPFAVPTFEWLVGAPHEVLALVTRPSRTRRGRKPPPNPMRDAAERLHVNVEAPQSINDEQGLALLRAWSADLFVVCDYGQILSDTALSLARLGGINLHASLLPAYRGAAPIHWPSMTGAQRPGSP